MTTSVAEAGQRLLQDDQPFDVAVLDGFVAAAYETEHVVVVASVASSRRRCAGCTSFAK